MSYCRFSEGDVYAYSTDGGVQFWVAGGFDKSLDHLCNTYNDAYEYAKSLRDVHGLTVPRHAMEMLRSDAIEEAKRFAGSGAIEDLEAELREEVEGQQGYDQMLRDRLRQQTELYVKAKGENERLRELVRGLHMAYVGALNECESLYEGLIWEYSGSIEDDVAKSRARFEADRHRFDAALRELGIVVDED